MVNKQRTQQPKPKPRHKRSRRNIPQEITQMAAKKKVMRLALKRRMNSRGCWIVPPKGKGGCNTDGYRQILMFPDLLDPSTIPKRGIAYLLHVLSMYAFGRRLPDVNEHASHICDNRACFNPTHLVAESIKINNSRRQCRGIVICVKCSHRMVLCEHKPCCIRS
jgi:hypothetical protein